MPGSLTDLVAGIHHGIDADEAMRQVARLTEWDRHQGSAGIAAAADFVAGEAERAGLAGVEVLTFPADGRTRWWTFTAPASWTPRSAHLSVPGRTALVDYPAQPYTLAAHSAAAHREAPLVRAQDDGWPPGAVVLVPSAAGLDGKLFARMREERASGFCVTTGSDRHDGAGRVELPPGSTLFGFSVVPGQMDALHRAHRRGERARVVVEVDTAPARMPVVVARAPTGSAAAAPMSPDACLITAHLCHPAPGANDNASGVAAALAAGRVLAARELRRPVGFLWAPEFVGLAAHVHRLVEEDGGPLPMMAVDLDMVGQDQRRCGGPLIVEHSPEYLPHFANALVEACVRALPPAARSYSGAVGCDVWAWRTTPFVGASDHAVLADRAIGCPAVQLGHWPDRFNHSGADTLDKVDPQELRRSAAIAASAAAVVATAGAPEADRLAHLLTRWTARRMTACLPPGDGPFAATLLTRRGRYGRDALDTLRPLGADPGVLGRQAGLLADLQHTLATAWDDLPAAGHGSPPLHRSWPGPFNLRALTAAVDETDRQWFLRRLADDRGGFYASAMSLAQSVDGVSGTADVVRTAQLDAGIRWEPGFGERFLAAMRGAGWVKEGEGRTS
ncbi:M28 family peptidase [Streptomyces sp. NPDC021080]|uniref:M28 family peptidase n=1 Tax=Streptomyces sp. NPDC021080 TaxID=3365110 RepID=UPI0037A905BF